LKTCEVQGHEFIRLPAYSLPDFLIRAPHLAIVLLLIVLATLACVTNTPIAKAPTPRPTRTAMPTFTLTPLPPTATPVPTTTDTPIPTKTLTPTATEPPTNTPIPTDTPLPTTAPTDTPLPTRPPQSAARPPTAPPMPTATAAVVINSPLPTPAPADPGTAKGSYEAGSETGTQNCESISITGKVTEADGNTPIQFVVIEVKGDKDKYKGPYLGKSDAQGQYVVSVGPLHEVGSVLFEAKISGGAGVSSKTVRWNTSKDCHEDGAIQTMTINWLRK